MENYLISSSSKERTSWVGRAAQFLLSVQSPDGASSVPNGPSTLYGTCYAWLGLYYLGRDRPELQDKTGRLIRASQNRYSGLFEGPELNGFVAPSRARHSQEHLLLHLTCSAVLPVAQQMGILLEPIGAAQTYCDLNALANWQNTIDWQDAWLEGNNILFVGQLLVYLRDVQKCHAAAESLSRWFAWLDRTADPKTGLWGTNGYCSPMEAVYGGYHQLLVYFYENHPLPNVHGLVDTVLSIQHSDGGFNPNGNGGACEDVDSVDILVNCYKRIDYRRAEIRHALRKCAKHVLATQNTDGGFPYALDQEQSHMGVPGTSAGPNISCTFPTWFRIHTLALISEVLPNDPLFSGLTFRFNKALSMGWHASPPEWKTVSDAITVNDYFYRLSDQAKKYQRLALRGLCYAAHRLRIGAGESYTAKKGK